ncbi:hypothetical protein [Streptomyces sp. NPDC102360]|uniref:hypothetical protein n=1 Tax=Streptomyces sp. NPDC102360 TaxID=3366160 RepID=UPI0037F6AE7A
MSKNLLRTAVVTLTFAAAFAGAAATTAATAAPAGAGVAVEGSAAIQGTVPLGSNDPIWCVVQDVAVTADAPQDPIWS